MRAEGGEACEHVVAPGAGLLRLGPLVGTSKVLPGPQGYEAGGQAGIDLRELTAATISRSSLTNHRNSGGVRLELTSARATISQSILANNAAGVTNTASGASPSVFLYGNTITNNTVAGLQIQSGSMTSLGNNIIRGNAGNEVPTTTIGQQ